MNKSEDCRIFIISTRIIIDLIILKKISTDLTSCDVYIINIY